MFGRRGGFPFPIIETPFGAVALVPDEALHPSQPATAGFPFSAATQPSAAYAGPAGCLPPAAATGLRESGEVNCCRPMTPKERLEARKQQLEGERDGINKRLEETTAALKLLEEQPGLTLLLDAVLRA